MRCLPLPRARRARLGAESLWRIQSSSGRACCYRYSRALKRSGIIWTADTLDAFIADSQQFVPANRMPYAGMPDATDRADLIAYLQQILK